MKPTNFDLATAQAYADAGDLETWIHSYLTTGHWANLGLSDGLKLVQRWWIGPVEVALSDLVRCCGPEPEMEYRVSAESWEKRVFAIADSLNDVAQLPPLIIQYLDGKYIICDGNHRYGAMQRKGWTRCWVLIWYDDPETWQQSPHHRS